MAKKNPLKKKSASKKSKKKQPKYSKCKVCLGFFLLSEKESHVCVVPTEEAVVSIFEDSEELRDAWNKFRTFASSLGDQRIYASAKAIMFSKTVCYLFVRPKKTKLEVCVFLPETTRHPLIKSVREDRPGKVGHVFFIEHEDQIDEPVVDWIRLAFESAR